MISMLAPSGVMFRSIVPAIEVNIPFWDQDDIPNHHGGATSVICSWRAKAFPKFTEIEFVVVKAA